VRIAADGAVSEPRRSCTSCGYDLRGLVGDRCPECGTSTTTEAAPSSPSVVDRVNAWLLEEEAAPSGAADPTGRNGAGGGVERCLACGYDLRGSTHVRCPECGTEHAPPHRERGQRRRALDDASLCEEPRTTVIAIRNLFVVSSLPVLVALAGAACVSALITPSGTPQVISNLWWYFTRILFILTAPLVPPTLTMKLVLATLVATLFWAQRRLTRPIEGVEAARQGLGVTSRWGRLARRMSVLHLLCLVAILFAFVAPASGLASILLRVTTALSILALFPLVTHLRRHASWMRDESADHALQIASVGCLVGFLHPLLAFIAGQNGLADFFLVLPTILGALALFIGLAYGLGSLLRSAAWSVRHAAERDESAIRKRAKSGTFDEKVRRLAKSTDPTGGRGRPTRDR